MIKLYYGKAGSGKTLNINKEIKEKLKLNPSTKIHVISHSDILFKDIRESAANFEFVNTNSPILPENYKDRCDLDIIVVEELFNSGVDYNIFKILMKLSEKADIYIAIQKYNDLLFNFADVISFCNRSRETINSKNSRLEDYILGLKNNMFFAANIINSEVI